MKTVGRYGNANVEQISAPTLAIEQANRYHIDKAVNTLWETAKDFVNAKFEGNLADHLQSLQAQGAAEAMNTFSKEQEVNQKYQKNIESGMSEASAVSIRDEELKNLRSAPIKANQATIGGFLHTDNVYVDSYKKTTAHNLATKTTEKILLNEDAKNYTPEQFNGYVYDLMQQDSQGMADDVKSVYTLSMTREFPNLMNQYQKVRLGHLIDQDRASKGEAVYSSFKSGSLGDQADVATYYLSPNNVNSASYFQSAIKHSLINKDPVTAQRLSDAVFADTRYTPEQRKNMKEAYDSAFAWVGTHTNWYDTAEADSYAVLTKLKTDPSIQTKEQVIQEVMKQHRAADKAGMGAYKIKLVDAYKAHDSGEDARKKVYSSLSRENLSSNLLDMLFNGGFSSTTLDEASIVTGISKDKLRTGLVLNAKSRFSSIKDQAMNLYAQGKTDEANQLLYSGVTKNITRIANDRSIPNAVVSDIMQQVHDVFGLARLGKAFGTANPLQGAELETAYNIANSFASMDSVKLLSTNEALFDAVSRSVGVALYYDGKVNLAQAQDLASKGLIEGASIEGKERSELLNDTADAVSSLESSEYWSDWLSVDLDEADTKFIRGKVTDLAQKLVLSSNLSPKDAAKEAFKMVMRNTQGMDTKTGLLIRSFTPSVISRDDAIYNAKAKVVSRWVKDYADGKIKGYLGDPEALFNLALNMTRKDFDNTVYDMAMDNLKSRYLKAGSGQLASTFKSWDFNPDSYSVTAQEGEDGITLKYNMTFRDLNGDADSFTFTNEDVIEYYLKRHAFDTDYVYQSFNVNGY